MTLDLSEWKAKPRKIGRDSKGITIPAHIAKKLSLDLEYVFTIKEV